jgi:DNA repair ATPase RecN
MNALVNQKQLNREKLSNMDKEKERLQEEITAIDGKLSKESENAKKQYADKRRIDEELAGLEADLSEKIKRYMEITAALSTAAEEIDGQKNRIYELHSAISSKKHRNQQPGEPPGHAGQTQSPDPFREGNVGNGFPRIVVQV